MSQLDSPIRSLQATFLLIPTTCPSPLDPVYLYCIFFFSFVCGALCMFLFFCFFFCNTPPTCNHHHRPLRYPNAQSTQCTLASSGRSWAAGSSFASPPWPSQAFRAAYQGQNSTGRFASEQPRSLASLARHRVRPAERQQHAVCRLHACDVGSMRCSLKLKLAVGSVMLDDDAAKTLLQTNF